MKKSPQLLELLALEAHMRPLEEKLATLKARRTETSEFHKQAVSAKNRAEASKFDRALTDIAVEIAAVEGELRPLQRSHAGIQTSMRNGHVATAA